MYVCVCVCCVCVCVCMHVLCLCVCVLYVCVSCVCVCVCLCVCVCVCMCVIAVFRIAYKTLVSWQIKKWWVYKQHMHIYHDTSLHIDNVHLNNFCKLLYGSPVPNSYHVLYVHVNKLLSCSRQCSLLHFGTHNVLVRQAAAVYVWGWWAIHYINCQN